MSDGLPELGSTWLVDGKVWLVRARIHTDDVTIISLQRDTANGIERYPLPLELFWSLATEVKP